MLKLNYYIHSILNSQYRLLFTLIIYILIYMSLKSTHTVYCMTEGSDIPVTAEAQTLTIRPRVELTNLEQLISRNIDSYIGDKALILSQQEEIARLAKDIEFHKELLKAIDTEGRLDLLVSEYGDTRLCIERVCEKYNKSLYEVLP